MKQEIKKISPYQNGKVFAVYSEYKLVKISEAIIVGILEASFIL